MKRKTIWMIMTIILSLTLYACQEEEILIDFDLDEITLTQGDVFYLEAQTNDPEGLSFASLDPSVFTIDSDGKITAVGEGQTTVIVSSKKNPLLTISIVVVVRKLITLDVDINHLMITEGNTATLSVQSNDAVAYESSDEAVFTIDQQGRIIAIKEGIATLTIRSTYDQTTQRTVDIEVRRRISIELIETVEVLWVGDTFNVGAESNGDLIFISEDPQRATINAVGQITAIAPGPVLIRVRSAYDQSISKTFSFTVHTHTESLVIGGLTKMNIGTGNQLIATSYPTWSLHDVTWTSDNIDIAEVVDGYVTALQTGTVIITATSIKNPEISESIEINIINTMMVSEDPMVDMYYNGVHYYMQVKLFRTISEALENALEDTIIYIKEGTYTEDLTIDKAGIQLIGLEPNEISGILTISADNITIDGLGFKGQAQVVAQNITQLSFIHNIIFEITYTQNKPFIDLINVKEVTIEGNTFDQLSHGGIGIMGIRGKFDIISNTFSNLGVAIDIVADPNETDTPNIMIYRNSISNTHTAISILSITPTDEPLKAIVRFNEVETYEKAAVSHELLKVDFTLNYWGTATLDPSKFEHIDPYMLRGYYTSKTAIPSESQLSQDVPLQIEVTNPIAEIVIGESHTITYGFLPMEFETTRIRFLTSNPDVLSVTQAGLITPLRSGTATITVRSSINTSIFTTITIVVTTTPGIDFAPTQIKSNILVGDQLMLNAYPFPVSYENESLIYETSDPLIATVSLEGVVTTHAAGTVTVTAIMANQVEVTNSITFNVYNALDEHDLMDLLTTQQVIFTTPREWRVYGVTFDFIEKRYDSVSRYHFGDISVNTSKIVPVSTGIRPGEGFSPHPEGITQYNPYNVYWVIVHETANTSPGAGALAHANYLWNLAMAGSQPFVSWHFTVDDRFIYQHLPEIERGFHAGDGSVLPGNSATYLGGGNRNGIGIEMAVNQDGDMYRTWQRAAKLAAGLLVKYNLPVSHMRYHIDFSGKMCPQSTIRGGMIPLFEEFAAIEYIIQSQYQDAMITFESHNTNLVDHTGRVIAMPDRGQTISYTITINLNGNIQQRTFYTYLPGTVK